MGVEPAIPVRLMTEQRHLPPDGVKPGRPGRPSPGPQPGLDPGQSVGYRSLPACPGHPADIAAVGQAVTAAVMDQERHLRRRRQHP